MSTTNGIDVSVFQGNIDWAEVKRSGVDFAIIRDGYATTQDSRFQENYTEATAAGVNVGAYHFSYAVSVENARNEADFVLTLLENKRFEYPIAFDFEQSSVQYAQSVGVNITRELATRIADTFLSRVQGSGYYVSLYSNLDFLENYFDMSVLSKYDLWLAEWADAPSYTGEFGMWQRSSSGIVSGISGRVDLDTAYKDYPTIMRENGLNGFTRDDEPDEVYQNGSSGLGVYLLQGSLSALRSKRAISTFVIPDGRYEADTTRAVREVQRKSSLTANGICSVTTADAIERLLKS